ncbi:hypothetical protein [Helicovermis profundi]|uniref:Uncharacterized protein n=1 Tax=Helicovermis profundi TaxID=3065157 RepID=A0AAU9E457_9FIRM|nr:hypothetical protein HLPR_03640 [Clostridia bacterium S502]
MIKRKNDINEYLKTDKYDMEGIAETLIKDTKDKKIAIEEDKKTLKNQIGTDLRENIPSQLFSVVSSIINMISKIDEVTKHED